MDEIKDSNAQTSVFADFTEEDVIGEMDIDKDSASDDLPETNVSLSQEQPVFEEEKLPKFDSNEDKIKELLHEITQDNAASLPEEDLSEIQQTNEQPAPIETAQEVDTAVAETTEENIHVHDSIQTEELTNWEELDSNNSVVKKYIVYVSKDFVQQMDSMNTDERSAYINDAIQKKIDSENIAKQLETKKRLRNHLIISIVVFILLFPLGLKIVNKAIMLTYENYKYSQDNIEKLYKQRFEKDRAFMRSIEYNKLHKIGN